MQDSELRSEGMQIAKHGTHADLMNNEKGVRVNPPEPAGRDARKKAPGQAVTIKNFEKLIKNFLGCIISFMENVFVCAIMRLPSSFKTLLHSFKQ